MDRLRLTYNKGLKKPENIFWFCTALAIPLGLLLLPRFMDMGVFGFIGYLFLESHSGTGRRGYSWTDMMTYGMVVGMAISYVILWLSSGLLWLKRWKDGR